MEQRKLSTVNVDPSSPTITAPEPIEIVYVYYSIGPGTVTQP